MVESEDGSRRICHPRGKKSQAVVGDRVLWQRGAQGQSDEGTIERVEERRNLLYRQDEIRTKSFAANLDQIVMLVASEPEFSESQLSRVLIAAEAERITPVIVLNKSDLAELFARAWERLAPYRRMGYEVRSLTLRGVPASPEASNSAIDLVGTLQAKTTLVLGPSGVGKSSLINSLVPVAAAQTQEISRALNSGKHTTTSTSLYWVDAARTTALIDSPGFQEFGLHQIEPRQLASLMPDLRAHSEHCKFYNCTHLHEPGCGVIAAVSKPGEEGEITERRYRIYQDLFEELSAPRRH
jgi:ribosome biogenesis GTPase